MRNLDIADTRAKLEQYALQPLNEGQLLVEHGHLLGSLPQGGADVIADNPDASDDEEGALDNAAMEFGVD